MSINNSVTMVKKLGASQIIGNVKKTVAAFCANDRDRVTLYTVFGTANGIKTGSTNHGEWVAFQGQFEAANHVTGEAFASNQAFITEPIQSLLMSALGDSDAVDFAITVEARRRDDLAIGYEYITTPHTRTQKSDPLAHLRAVVPQLAKPTLVAELPESDSESEAPKVKVKAKQ